MNNRIQDFFAKDSGDKKKDESAVWDHSNLDNFHEWIKDNKTKVDGGKTVMGFVMGIGSEVAAAACVKWLYSKNVDRDVVESLASKVVDMCIEACDREQKAIIRDCAGMFATTGSTVQVMLIAFVCYSHIGATVAQSLISEAS